MPDFISSVILTPGTSATPGAQAVTVPADAQLVVVTWSNYINVSNGLITSLTSTFADFTGKINQTGASNIPPNKTGVGVAYGLVTATGSQTITFTWTDNIGDGPHVYVSFIKGINTSDYFLDFDSVSPGGPSATASLTVDTQSTCLLLVHDGDANTTIQPTPTGYTLRNSNAANNHSSLLLTANAPGATTTTVNSSTTNYAALSAISIKSTGGDVTAPTLTSAAGTATGATTATVGATTDEANGTMYVVVTTSATQPSIAQIKAGQDHTGAAAAYASSQAITTTGAKTFSATGLTSSTTYYAHLVHTDSAANDSNRITSASFTTDTVDTTAPTLTSGVGTVESNALIVVGATTDEANGTMYVVLTTSSTPPSATQVRNGQDHTGAAAVFAANQAIGSTGAKTFNATGLTQLTAYYPYIVHRDAAGNDSSVLSIGSRTTFRDGATGQAVIDNTGPVGGNPEGIMYNDVVLPGDADKWFSYRIVSGPTTPGDFSFNADGSFSYSGTTGDSFDYQLEVDGVDIGSPQTVNVDPVDGTAPTLTSPTATATGTTTADGSVSTNEANGTLYWLASVNASESAATVKAGSSQAVSSTGVQNVAVTGLTASTSYYLHFVHRDSSGNDSAVATSAQFTTDTPPDTTPPTLTSPTVNSFGSASVNASVTTNEANGTLYWLVNTSSSATAVAVKAGSSQAVSATGAQAVYTEGLTPSTLYYVHFLHRDAAGNDSAVSTTAPFTTDAAPPGATSGIVRQALALRLGL